MDNLSRELSSKSVKIMLEQIKWKLYIFAYSYFFLFSFNFLSLIISQCYNRVNHFL